MSAPAALAYSKLVYPETEESRTHIQNIEMPQRIRLTCSEERNVIEAASNGASVGLLVIGNIVANLVAFLAFIAFLNGTLLWFSSIVTMDFVTFEDNLGFGERYRRLHATGAVKLGPLMAVPSIGSQQSASTQANVTSVNT
ncbi:hypothetical protein HPB50_010947 [Hyalomma asiaticum]|uniref:Uncharacterized protein n=1 Tax=Hyalomma asiaticum TaxID=266040 RepID=A0ACB7STS4_HYAAI|nr:hypothetical protein HPB50_010947 [Hyalomma asiaticum]